MIDHEASEEFKSDAEYVSKNPLQFNNMTTRLARAYLDLRAENELLRGLAEDTQAFLKYLIAGKSQYYFGDRLMANGMSHAQELDQHIKKELDAWRSRCAT